MRLNRHSKRHPNSKRWGVLGLARKPTVLTGKQAEQRWVNSKTQGPQQPAAYHRPTVDIPLPWMRAVSAVTSEFV